MKTTENRNDETHNQSTKGFLAVKRAKRFLAVSAVTLLALGSMVSANAQYVYSVNIVGFRDVADRTVELLTKPMTTMQRQARHAKNFIELPPSQRALYLHTVAFAMSQAMASAYDDGATLCLTSTDLVEHLLAVPSIYDAPAVPSEYSQIVAAHMAIVKVALQELNALISDQVTNNSDFQQAINAGAINGWYDGALNLTDRDYQLNPL